jgi:hypothetical protein
LTLDGVASYMLLGSMLFRHLLPVLGLYVAVQCCWLVALPPFEGSDEVQHYDYARYVAVNGHLPDRVPSSINDGGFLTGEWTQEPAYYVMLGLALRWTGVQDVPPGEGQATNPHGIFNDGNAANIFAHWTAMPPRAVYGLLVGRLVSVICGLGTILCVFGAIRVCCREDHIAALAATCVTFVPQFGAQHVFITNDTAAAFWASLASFLVVQFVVRGERSWLLALAIGATGGLAVATKLTAAVAIVGLPLALWRLRRVVAWMPHALAWGAGMLATAGVAFGRNWLVFGDPLATALKNAVVTQFAFHSSFHPRELASYVDLLDMLFHGFWTGIGWVRWSPDVPWLWALFGALTTFLITCVIAAGRLVAASPRGDSTPSQHALTVMLGVLALHSAAFVVSISIWAGYSARYFLPMTVPLIVVATMGSRVLLNAMRRRLGLDAACWTMVGVLFTVPVAWLTTLTTALLAFHFEGLRR